MLDSIVDVIADEFVLQHVEDRDVKTVMAGFKQYAEQWLRRNPIASATVQEAGVRLFFAAVGQPILRLGDVPGELTDGQEDYPPATPVYPRQAGIPTVTTGGHFQV